MRVFDDKLFEDFKQKINSGESIIEFMSKMGCSTTSNNGTFYKCVFHTDKTPSLSINDKKGMFKCFSCGRGGHYFDFVYQYHKVVLSYKKSPKEFANELISKNKTLQRKYGIESLDKPIEFSPKTIEYMLEVKKMSNKSKLQLKKSLAQGVTDIEVSKRLELERRIRDTKDVDDIMLLFSEIQKGNIVIE